jgi:high-affinity nickel-transport protein
MQFVTTEWLTLATLVFLLGLEHGFDADHLAAIDGLTRHTSAQRPRMSRFSGLLFSLGHGLVVTIVAILVATVAQQWHTPEWLEHTGAWISIAFLTFLGVLNLRAVWTTPVGQVVTMQGIRGKYLSRFTTTSHPLLIAGVGAAFALSFDTISQTVMFSLSGSHLAGWTSAAMLGLVFTSGMVLTDAIGGLFVGNIIARADRRAAQLSRLMSACVGGVSLLIAAWGVMRYVAPEFRAALEPASPLLAPLIIASVPLTLIAGTVWMNRASRGAAAKTIFP